MGKSEGASYSCGQKPMWQSNSAGWESLTMDFFFENSYLKIEQNPFIYK